VSTPKLARPGSQLVTNEQYNQLFTIQGTITLLSSRRRSSLASRT
jgi:hypothetical protein